MINVILTIHTLIVLGLIGIVLLQRSEGGALGIGGGGGAGGGGFMTSRGAANALTRTTSILAGLFFITSISLAMIADRGESETEVIRDLTGEEIADPNAPISSDDLSNALGRGDDDAPETTTPDSGDLSDALGGSDTGVAEDVNIEEALESALDADETPATTDPDSENADEETPPPGN